MNLPQKHHTIGSLIEALKDYPLNTNVSCTSGDIGGYDVSTKPFCSIFLSEDGIRIGHAEYEAYEAYEKKEITYEEFLNYVEEEEDI